MGAPFSIQIAIVKSATWKSGNPKLRPQTIWKYSLADFSRANDEIEHVDWDMLLLDRNIDEAWQLWETTFMSIIEQCIPRKVLPKRRKLPWVNSGIRHAIQSVITCITNQNAIQTLELSSYKQQRNKVVSQLRSAKRSFVDTMPTVNTKEFWKAIKLLNGKGSQTIPVLNHDGRQRPQEGIWS